MKQILKKAIAAVICGSLLLSLAACGGNNSSSESKPWNDLGVSEKEYRDAEKAVRDADRKWHMQNGY